MVSGAPDVTLYVAAGDRRSGKNAQTRHGRFAAVAGLLCLAMVATASFVSTPQGSVLLASSQSLAAAQAAHIASLASSFLIKAQQSTLPALISYLHSWTPSELDGPASEAKKVMAAMLADDFTTMCANKASMLPKLEGVLQQLKHDVGIKNVTMRDLRDTMDQAVKDWSKTSAKYDQSIQKEKTSEQLKGEGSSEFEKFSELVDKTDKELKDKAKQDEKDTLAIKVELDSVAELIQLVKDIMGDGSNKSLEGSIDSNKQLKQTIESRVFKLKLTAVRGEGLTMDQLAKFGDNIEAKLENATSVLETLYGFQKDLYRKLHAIDESTADLQNQRNQYMEQRHKYQIQLVEESNNFRDAHEEQRVLRPVLQHLEVDKELATKKYQHAKQHWDEHMDTDIKEMGMMEEMIAKIKAC